MDFKKKALEVHKKYKGKIEINSKVPVSSNDDLSILYTPGVAEPCKKIYENEEDVYKYTIKSNTVAVISDGSTVLGLGNIGSKAAIPVMEGKSLLLKKFAGIDSFPICLDTQNSDEIVETIKNISPIFGGVNLEDIESPKCFEIEERLKKELDIPVFHDDQHGTAIVVTAALLNAIKIVGKKIENLKVVLNGPGSAGTAIIKMLKFAGVKNIIACDEFGILYKNREKGINDHKIELCEITNLNNIKGTLEDAIVNADVFIGVSVANVLTPAMIKNMANDSIVFALANPDPEISYNDAKEAGAKVVGTGRSDFPNQINNVLAFPGIFRGALDARAKEINNEMKYAAVKGISELVSKDELSSDFIIPSPFDTRVAANVAKHVVDAAKKTGVSRL